MDRASIKALEDAGDAMARQLRSLADALERRHYDDAAELRVLLAEWEVARGRASVLSVEEITGAPAADLPLASRKAPAAPGGAEDKAPPAGG